MHCFLARLTLLQKANIKSCIYQFLLCYSTACTSNQYCVIVQLVLLHNKNFKMYRRRTSVSTNTFCYIFVTTILLLCKKVVGLGGGAPPPSPMRWTGSREQPNAFVLGISCCSGPPLPSLGTSSFSLRNVRDSPRMATLSYVLSRHTHPGHSTLRTEGTEELTAGQNRSRGHNFPSMETLIQPLNKPWQDMRQEKLKNTAGVKSLS